MRTLLLLLLLVDLSAAESKIIVKPDAHRTLVNPNCSHCVDEAKRRQDELKNSDPVLMWTRGKYDGGAIPIRFFLNPYRVISDTYGVFVYDPDAGYARAFKASLDFKFHGWRNGIMVMKHKDGTLYSCLSGLAFEGPNKGQQLEAWPTIVSNWGFVMKNYPATVAYHMFEKYRPIELPTKPNEDSVSTRTEVDKRLPAEESVLGVIIGGRATPRAFRTADLDRAGNQVVVTSTFECGNKAFVFWDGATRTATAYRPIAHKRVATKELSKQGDILETKTGLEFMVEEKSQQGPFLEKNSGSHFDIAGRGIDGPLKGWTLDAPEAIVCKWFAWAAENPHSTIYQAKDPAPIAEPKKDPTPSDPKESIIEVAGTAEFLRAIPKKLATVQSVNATARAITLLIDGEKQAKEWPLTADAEVKIAGWWGRIGQLKAGDRVWAWFHSDRKKNPTSIFMVADSASETDIHQGKPTEALEAKRKAQQNWLLEHWQKEGLPGTITFVHVAGEVELMLDHEAMRWARSLNVGDKVNLVADPPIVAVVKDVKPRRERTRLSLVVNGLDIAELQSGQRTLVRMTAPAKEILESPYPPDLGRKRSKEERIDWFLSSIYCTCKVGNDICTGDFYTLGSCNPNGCGMPNATRRKIAGLIDKGQDDKQIWDTLFAERGDLMVKPHLRK